MQHCLNTQPSLLEAEMFDNRTNLFFFKFLLIFMLSAVLSAPFIINSARKPIGHEVPMGGIAVLLWLKNYLSNI